MRGERRGRRPRDGCRSRGALLMIGWQDLMTAGRASGKFGHCKNEALAVRGMGHRLPAPSACEVAGRRVRSAHRVCAVPAVPRAPAIAAPRTNRMTANAESKTKSASPCADDRIWTLFSQGFRDWTARTSTEKKVVGAGAAEGCARDELSGRGVLPLRKVREPASGALHRAPPRQHSRIAQISRWHRRRF